MSDYFTDREYGTPPPSTEVINERVWAGLLRMIKSRITDGSFGLGFPNQCSDGQGPYGCSEYGFSTVLKATIPSIEWPWPSSEPPETPIILDLLEFCAKAVGKPIELDFHAYMNHRHLDWDREAGLDLFISDVNMIFKRNGISFELTSSGEARRLLPAPIADWIGRTLFQTGDAETDRLLDVARRRFLSPELDDRKDALEKLWDAFERLKTLEPGGNKPAQADALLNRVAVPGSGFRNVLANEATKLTDIGNSFRIRHSEVKQETLSSPDQVDYLFTRMFAFVQIVLRGSGRGG